MADKKGGRTLSDQDISSIVSRLKAVMSGRTSAKGAAKGTGKAAKHIKEAVGRAAATTAGRISSKYLGKEAKDLAKKKKAKGGSIKEPSRPAPDTHNKDLAGKGSGKYKGKGKSYKTAGKGSGKYKGKSKSYNYKA